ncbi:hypothetical protein [Staphylococcus simiae]|uniref:Lipoprotein n=1 Tax=Staphylococcus simiae CCM 7213 = CCUG 51256 TaxID=911238 RepID=G5JLY6_9STAP|nr:hypothetical protein [Staphylococcus simiae]EHJ06815.1 hypothetical protein SS7213T_12527 [Staphylococcus simiae CCM 7213 = CCUG 51256]PNZ13865.1 hypothetical protein CD113_03525 [Staphylococcus simiae]
MKFKYVASGLTAAALLLTACGNNDSDSKDSKVNDSTTTKDDKLSKSQQEHSSKASSSKSNSKSSSSDNHQSSDSNKASSKSSMTADNLDQQHKLALALFDSNAGQYSITAQELQAGEFTGSFTGNNPHQTKPISKLQLNKTNSVKNVPAGVSIYIVDQSKGSFRTVIAISRDEVIIAGTQSELTYQSMQKSGQVYKVDDLIKRFGDEPDLDSVASKISISDQLSDAESEATSNSSSDDDDSDTSSNSSSDDDDSSSDTTVTRANVIDKVEDYEGHKLDTDEYTFKEPEQMGDGKWGFSYTDKSGDLAGSYIIDQDGNVTKYDEHGDEI